MWWGPRRLEHRWFGGQAHRPQDPLRDVGDCDQRDELAAAAAQGAVEHIEAERPHQRELIALITQPHTAQRILVAMGLPAEPPELAPARPPPQPLLPFVR